MTLTSTSLLEVDFGPTSYNGRQRGESWHVRLKTPPAGCGIDDRVLIDGYGRRKDAEIALDVLAGLPVNWTGSMSEIQSQWDQLGGSKAAAWKIADRLQW